MGAGPGETLRRRGHGVAIALVAGALLLTFWVSVADVGAEPLEQAFTRALLGYAIARGLNGAISVAQGTEVAVQPAGVGVNFAPGEILDPINDLVERFSWIMMLAASSLGVQRVLLAMSAWWGVAALLVVLGLGWLGLRWWAQRRGGDALRSGAAPTGALSPGGWVNGLGRAFLFLALLRLAMPAVVLANDAVYRLFLAEDYAVASAELERARDAIGTLNEEVAAEGRPVLSGGEEPGLLDRARGAWDQALRSIDVDRQLERYAVAVENISENTIRLIVVFMMQTVVFPLVFLFVAWGLLKRLFGGRAGYWRT